MFKRLIIAFLSLLMVITAYSQKENFIEGFIVNYPNDTIYGFIKESSTEKNCMKITFKDINDNISKIKHSNKKIVSYKCGDDYYLKLPLDTVRRKVYNKFLKVVCTGKITLLRYDYTIAIGSFAGGPAFDYQTDYYILNRNSQIQKVLKSNYSNIMKMYYGENLDKSKKYKFKNIEEDIKKLNKRK